MINDLLPIGSIVLLKEGKKRLMIEGIKQKTEDGTFYDYVGVLYPEGYINDEYKFVFNQDDIEVVQFLGFVDIEHTMFRAKLQEKLQEEGLE